MSLGRVNKGKYSVWLEKKIIPPPPPKKKKNRHSQLSQDAGVTARGSGIYINPNIKYVLIVKERINNIMSRGVSVFQSGGDRGRCVLLQQQPP